MTDIRIKAPDTIRVIARPSERRPALRPGTSPAPPQAVTGPRLDADERLFGFLVLLGGAAATIGFTISGITGRTPTTAAVALVPLFLLGNWLVLRRLVGPVAGTGFVTIALAGLALRYVSAVPRMIGGVDSIDYQRTGVRLAAQFRTLDFTVETGRSIPGTGALRYLTGIVNVFTGSSFLATFLVFASIALWGQVLLLLAFRGSLSKRQFRVACIVMMLWPSLTFWPSSIGKEAASLFGLGLASLGASMLYRRQVIGLPVLAAGVAAIGIIRPHVAMIALAGLLAGSLARPTGTRRRLGGQIAVVALVTVGAMLLTDASAALFNLEQLDGYQDVSLALDFAEARTSQDQSQFVAPRVDTITDYPWALITVLFRPFPWEADGPMALASGLEGLLLAGLVLASLPGLIGELRNILARNMLLYAVAFHAVFVFAFAALGNFGILSRQRAQVLPFVLLLVAVGLAHQSARARSMNAVNV